MSTASSIPSLEIEVVVSDEDQDCLTKLEKKIFPLDIFRPPIGFLCLCCFCPDTVKAYVPVNWRVIRDWTHLALVFGVWASLLLVASSFLNIFGDLPHPPKCWRTGCFEEFLAIVYLMPCAMYFCRIIGQYDERLIERQADLQEKKSQVMNSYQAAIADMDNFIAQAAESSSGLAERSFESKRRDFTRFLERVKVNCSSIDYRSPEEADKLLNEFRRFVENWLMVFKECSIDPIYSPTIVASSEELRNLKTIEKISELVLERLRLTEVKFVSVKRDDDKNRLNKTRLSIAALTTGGEADVRWWKSPTDDVMNTVSNRWKMPSWVGCKTADLPDPPQTGDYPKVCKCICCHIIMLSHEHMLLLFGFFIGWVIMAIECFPGGYSANYLTVVQVVLVEICLGMVLARFEEVDVMQQLERETNELKKTAADVQRQRDEMQTFWERVQEVTELWLHRTVPRLDLFHELQCHLENCDGEVFRKLESTNQSLESCEMALGGLELWRSGGKLSKEDKRQFSDKVNDIVSTADLDQIIARVKSIKNVEV